jgi:hypothetical protein
MEAPATSTRPATTTATTPSPATSAAPSPPLRCAVPNGFVRNIAGENTPGFDMSYPSNEISTPGKRTT